MKVPPFPIAPGTELRLNGQLQVVKRVSDTGDVTLMCPLRGTEVDCDLQELVEMRLAGKLEPAQPASKGKEPSGKPTYASMSEEARKRVLRRVAYCRVAVPHFPIGPKNPRLQTLIAEAAASIGDPQPPSVHSVYRWLRRFVNSGYDTAVFVQDAAVMRQRKPRRLTDELCTSLRGHIQALLEAYPRATLNGITNLALAKTARDAGYASFVTKEGVEEPVDLFIKTAEAVLHGNAVQRRNKRSKQN